MGMDGIGDPYKEIGSSKSGLRGEAGELLTGVVGSVGLATAWMFGVQLAGKLDRCPTAVFCAGDMGAFLVALVAEASLCEGFASNGLGPRIEGGAALSKITTGVVGAARTAAVAGISLVLD